MVNVARLPMPLMDAYDWQYRGACQDADTETFFPPEWERGPRRMMRERRAKEFCARCEVVETCLQHALTVREPYGVWGGLNPREREALTGQKLTG